MTERTSYETDIRPLFTEPNILAMGESVQPSELSPLGVVLLRARKPEVNQDPIAHGLGDKSVIARDRPFKKTRGVAEVQKSCPI